MTFDLDALRQLLVVVKPSLEGRTLSPDDSLVYDLGLDSLDLLQLGRSVQRRSGRAFVMEEWALDERAKQKQAYKLSALLAAVEGP